MTVERLPGYLGDHPVFALLSNLVLDELDRELERRGLPFVRYAIRTEIRASWPKAKPRS
jgi:RNA-directed DNA polymerase